MRMPRQITLRSVRTLQVALPNLSSRVHGAQMRQPLIGKGRMHQIVQPSFCLEFQFLECSDC